MSSKAKQMLENLHVLSGTAMVSPLEARAPIQSRKIGVLPLNYKGDDNLYLKMTYIFLLVALTSPRLLVKFQKKYLFTYLFFIRIRYPSVYCIKFYLLSSFSYITVVYHER